MKGIRGVTVFFLSRDECREDDAQVGAQFFIYVFNGKRIFYYSFFLYNKLVSFFSCAYHYAVIRSSSAGD